MNKEQRNVLDLTLRAGIQQALMFGDINGIKPIYYRVTRRLMLEFGLTQEQSAKIILEYVKEEFPNLNEEIKNEVP